MRAELADVDAILSRERPRRSVCGHYPVEGVIRSTSALIVRARCVMASRREVNRP